MEPIEGYIKILGFKVFCRTYGSPTKGTVLCLHGGPGATHHSVSAPGVFSPSVKKPA